MYNLPDSTNLQKQLPKKAIYSKFEMKASQHESFDADITRIDIIGVVSPATIPALVVGKTVKEFYVLNVQLKRSEYDKKNIELLLKLIPQKMILALQFEEKVQFVIQHTKPISSVWQPVEEAVLILSGLNLDVVWENLVKEIGKISVEDGRTLIKQIADNEQKAKLLSKINALERKMASEKQPRRKREYFEQIKNIKNLL